YPCAHCSDTGSSLAMLSGQNPRVFLWTSVHVGCDFGLGLAIHSTILPMRAKTLEIWLVTIHPSPSPPCENESPHMNAAIPGRRPVTEEISGLIERVSTDAALFVFCLTNAQGRVELFPCPVGNTIYFF